MVGWHHRLDGHEFEQAPWVGDGQGSLVCCNLWGHKESDTTEQLNWGRLFASPPYFHLNSTHKIIITHGSQYLVQFSSTSYHVLRSPLFSVSRTHPSYLDSIGCTNKHPEKCPNRGKGDRGITALDFLICVLYSTLLISLAMRSRPWCQRYS